jgi:hypothetical protein
VAQACPDRAAPAWSKVERPTGRVSLSRQGRPHDGIEAVTSSVSVRSRSIGDLGEHLLALLTVWVPVVLAWSVTGLLARSAPSSLQHEWTLMALVALASRRAGPPLPGRACPVQVERPTGRTTWTGQARSGGLRCAAGDRSAVARHPRVARVHGPEALPAGGHSRVHGPEALPAGGKVSGYWTASSTSGRVLSPLMDPMKSPISGLLAWSMAALTCTPTATCRGSKQNRAVVRRAAADAELAQPRTSRRVGR